jgi:hypothetical protein
MLITKRRKYSLTIANVYFGKSLPSVLAEAGDADVIVLYQAREPRNGAEEFHTLHVDLQQDEATILANMSQGTRYEIKRAEARDNLELSIMPEPSVDQLREFSEFYDVFARMKALSPISLAALESLRGCHALSLSRICDAARNPLCWHAYIVDGERARLLHSASHFRALADSSQRNLAGRANRYLHWLDMRAFKELGFATFDFGGLAVGVSGGEQEGLDGFKRGFGGVEVVEYDYCQARSLAGRLYLQLGVGRQLFSRVLPT